MVYNTCNYKLSFFYGTRCVKKHPMRDIFCDPFFIHFGKFEYSKSPMKNLYSDGLAIHSKLVNLPRHWHEEHFGKRNDLTKRVEIKRMLFDNSNVYFVFLCYPTFKIVCGKKNTNTCWFHSLHTFWVYQSNIFITVSFVLELAEVNFAK